MNIWWSTDDDNDENDDNGDNDGNEGEECDLEEVSFMVNGGEKWKFNSTSVVVVLVSAQFDHHYYVDAKY